LPKARPFAERSVAAARRVLDEAGVSRPHEIDVEALAAKNGAMVVYGPMATARAMIVRRGREAIIHVDERLRGKTAARFPVAHELAHHLLHEHVDHYRQCTVSHEPRGEAEWEIEHEANDCAAEMIIPEPLGAPFCAAPRATVEGIDRLARAFSASFEMSAIRMTELTMAPCAVVAAEHGRVKWAIESLTFPGTIRRFQPLHRASLAARLPGRVRADREEEVPGGAWKSDGALVERAWRVGRGRVLSWIVAG
jgi:Zn-dependent peptidase ImmA (M78 family)